MIEASAARAGLALALLALVTVASVARTRVKPFRPREGQLSPALLPPDGAPLVAFYFTSRLCGECASTPDLLAEAAPQVPQVALAVERHARLARDLGVTETPTILLVDATGRIRAAFAGNPALDELRTAADAASSR